MQADALIIAKGSLLFKWRGSSQPMAMRWRSKEFVLPPNAMLQSARIMSPDVSKVSFSLYVDGQLAASVPVGSVPNGAFRLPALRGRIWQVEVGGAAPVERITLGSSMSEVCSR
jgi:hypothetical protein